MILRTSRMGFTLIEIIVAMSVIAILSTVGIAAFLNYSRSQSVAQATAELYTTLNLARSRAQSQVKPSSGSCGPPSYSSLEGYRVRAATPTRYDLYAICGGSQEFIEFHVTPSGVTLSSSASSFTFAIITGNVAEAAAGGTPITVSGYGSSQIITVYNDGRIVQ